MSAPECDNTTVDQKIANLELLLSSGANSITIDGVTTSLNVESLRQQIRDLKRLSGKRRQFLRVGFTRGYDGY